MIVAVSQRVVIDARTGERRDALDRRWPIFLRHAGLLPLAVPNMPDIAFSLLDVFRPQGIVLTGGDDLANLGGASPERDETELALLAHARHHALPLLGVCRGMQVIQSCFRVKLERVDGHVASTQAIQFDGRRAIVNSYHNFGSRETAPGLTICGVADDGVVKAVRADSEPIIGIMWHPERIDPARAEDLALFRTFFGASP